MTASYGVPRVFTAIEERLCRFTLLTVVELPRGERGEQLLRKCDRAISRAKILRSRLIAFSEPYRRSKKRNKLPLSIKELA